MNNDVISNKNSIGGYKWMTPSELFFDFSNDYTTPIFTPSESDVHNECAFHLHCLISLFRKMYFNEKSFNEYMNTLTTFAFGKLRHYHDDKHYELVNVPGISKPLKYTVITLKSDRFTFILADVIEHKQKQFNNMKTGYFDSSFMQVGVLVDDKIAVSILQNNTEFQNGYK